MKRGFPEGIDCPLTLISEIWKKRDMEEGDRELVAQCKNEIFNLAYDNIAETFPGVENIFDGYDGWQHYPLQIIAPWTDGEPRKMPFYFLIDGASRYCMIEVTERGSRRKSLSWSRAVKLGVDETVKLLTEKLEGLVRDYIDTRASQRVRADKQKSGKNAVEQLLTDLGYPANEINPAYRKADEYRVSYKDFHIADGSYPVDVEMNIKVSDTFEVRSVKLSRSDRVSATITVGIIMDELQHLILRIDNHEKEK